MFLTSKLSTCFTDSFTSNMKSQSTAYLLNESEHTYWILDLENEVYPIWVIWTSGLQECKGQAKVRGTRLWFFRGCPCRRHDKCNAHWGYLERPNIMV
jgi:hypothetical protein